jgi:serine/threonine protein kinase
MMLQGLKYPHRKLGGLSGNQTSSRSQTFMISPAKPRTGGAKVDSELATKNIVTGEIVNYADLQKLKKREEYISLKSGRSKLTEEDFERKVEAGSWKLLNLISGVHSIENILIYMSDQIQNAYDLETTFETGRSFLVFAVARGDQLLIEKLIQMKPDLINKPDDEGKTPLHYAVLWQKLKIVNTLLEYRADVRAVDAKLQSAMHFAAIKGFLDLYLLFKARGGEGTAKDIYGMRPLDYACSHEDYKQYLMMEGIMPESISDHNRNTSLLVNRSGTKKKSVSKDTFVDSIAEEDTLDATPSINHFKTTEKAAFDYRRKFLAAVGVINQKPHVENSNYYRDIYGEHLALRYQGSYPEEGEIEERSPTEEIDSSRSSKSQRATPTKVIEPLIKIKAKDFKILGKIGKGSFGEIFCVAVRNLPGSKFAMKSYSKDQVLSNNLIRFLFMEKKIMTNYSHPFLVRLHYSFQTEQKLFLIMEYCEKRDLSKLVGKISEHQLKILACEMILAVKALHQQGIVHRDIKPENVLISADGHIKLADFGLAKEKMIKNELTYTFCGSIAYLPPEIISKSGHNRSIDWYLLGELMYEMICGTPPFYNGNKDVLYENILHKKVEYPRHISDVLKDFISLLLDRNISTRLGSKFGAKEIMEHPYFVGVDWNRVYNKGYHLFDPSLLKSYVLEAPAQEMIPERSEPAELGHCIELPYWSFVRPEES